jgi:hypothetical protein
VGADHKGPLAALIVLALISVILLVTAVRSQAAPELRVAHHPATHLHVPYPSQHG